MDYFTIVSNFLSFLMYLFVLFIIFEIRLLIDEKLKLSFTYLGVAALSMTTARIFALLVESGITELEKFKEVAILIAPIFFIAGLVTFYREIKGMGRGRKGRGEEASEYKPSKKTAKKQPNLQYTALGRYLDLTGRNPRFRR